VTASTDWGVYKINKDKRGHWKSLINAFVGKSRKEIEMKNF